MTQNERYDFVSGKVKRTFGDVRIGLARGWRFCDVLGLDPELLQLVPQPVLGAVLLFPCSERIYAARKQQDAALRSGGSFLGASAKSLFLHPRQALRFGRLSIVLLSSVLSPGLRHLSY